MTERMHKNCNGFVGYKCAPIQTALRPASMQQNDHPCLKRRRSGKICLVRVPILIAGEQSSTTVEPMITLINELRETEKKEGIMAASYLMGFPWADNPDSSVAVYVVAENQELADAEAPAAGRLYLVQKRMNSASRPRLSMKKEAIDAAFESIGRGQYPVFLSDSGDNPTAGSSSDVTEFVKMLIADERVLSLRTRWLTAAFMIPRPQRPAKARWVRRSP